MTETLEERKSWTGAALNGLLGLLIVLFCVSLFKHISYPLLWNDEAESAMLGQRVLEYGYPKVHDGKNTVFLFTAYKRGVRAGYNLKHDAITYMTWGAYYWAAIGVYLARFAGDLYAKTALLRLPFAIMGFLGLLLFGLSARRLFSDKNHYKVFLILFAFVELFSVSLVLHLREVRYYPLLVFMSACFVYVYSSYFLYKRMSDLCYYILMTVLLFFAYHVSFIEFGIFGVVLAFNRGVALLAKVLRTPGGFKRELGFELKAAIPLVLSAVLLFPFLLFFETFRAAAVVAEAMEFTHETYWENLGMILNHLARREFLYTLIVVKIAWLIFRFSARDQEIEEDKRSETIRFRQFSFFLTSFLILYALIIARTPHLFVRYYIPLQPVMVMILVTDLFVVSHYIQALQKPFVFATKLACSLFLLATFCLNAVNKIPFIKGHLYEITHQYKGVLDYVIPYIRQNFKNPENLVIATNYEELSYMYYLGSKVTIGYVYNNLEEDLRYTPDIIIFRKRWGSEPRFFKILLTRDAYRRVSFPVFDYEVNNIPEFDYKFFNHLFQTKFASTEEEKADLWVKEDHITEIQGGG
jgi:hypothetical protein